MATRSSHTNPLRTQAPHRLDTVGERIRHARIDADLSQEALAQRISAISARRVSKAAVSKWESGAISMPLPESVFAMQAITGFSAHWIVTGKGDPKASVAPAKPSITSPLDRDVLQRAIAVAMPGADAAVHARVIAGLYDVLLDTPDINDRSLAAFAAALSSQLK